MHDQLLILFHRIRIPYTVINLAVRNKQLQNGILIQICLLINQESVEILFHIRQRLFLGVHDHDLHLILLLRVKITALHIKVIRCFELVDLG